MNAWDEPAIKRRGSSLAKEIIKIWPRPATAEPYVVGGGGFDSEDEESVRSPEDVERFWALYEKICPTLADRVFSEDAGWTRPKRSRTWAYVSFCRWESPHKEGFIIQDDESVKTRTNRIFIAVYVVGEEHANAFKNLLRRDELRIRKELGGRIAIDYDEPSCPVYEYVPENDPDEIVKRFEMYRTVLSPLLDQVLPPRAKNKAEKAVPDPDGKRVFEGTIGGKKYLLDAGNGARVHEVRSGSGITAQAAAIGRTVIRRDEASEYAVSLLIKQWRQERRAN